MSKNTLYDKIWDLHKVATLETEEDQIIIGRHLMHEITSPQAFAMLDEDNGSVKYPTRNFATVDHIVPTTDQTRPFADPQAEALIAALEKNCAKHGITFFNLDTGRQGVIHVVMPELGLIWPGMTVCCGDSHTATHGAFGALSFGIGSTQVRYVLETGTLPMKRLKVKRINVTGKLSKGVTAKDVILRIIRDLGVMGGLGFAYEFAGDVFDAMSMEERMTVCNMAIEGGARIGYMNPDEKTFAYLKNAEYAPKGAEFDKMKTYWKSVASGPDAVFDAEYTLDGAAIEPSITWGITPAHNIGIGEKMPAIESFPEADRQLIKEAYDYMGLEPGKAVAGTPFDVAFIGSCTNGRISDFREAAAILKGKKVAPNITLLAVPGSQQVKKQCEAEGLDKVFIASGAQWRNAGCSMCLAMNADKLVGAQRSLSTSNRNFKGRQGSPTGRTMLASPATVAASAIKGCAADPREFME